MLLPHRKACLEKHIQTYIQAKGGWISFAEFMQKALYEPTLGYYVSGTRKIGKDGDFMTAPEISPAFSQTLARYCESVFHATSSPASILEFGAGTGTMAADILLTLEKRHALPERYYILEVSPDFSERQLDTLRHQCPHLIERIVWLSTLPKNFTGVVLANEVLDALPVHLFEVQKKITLQKGIALESQKLIWRLGSEVDLSSVTDISNLEDGYTSEYCPAIYPWLKDLYTSMLQGTVLLIDYGFLEHEYYHPQRDQGTLMCHYRHRAHTDPLLHIGLQDITAHVNFTAVAQAAEKSGFSVDFYSTQEKFLVDWGILEETNVHQLSLEEQYGYTQGLKKLLLPSEMGELFKVMELKTPSMFSNIHSS
ncbi:MAG: SAM-dependent methyltransferase [Gammaproteobacteria bacterium]|nr:SAM-dependent methyltransferase [Gammaproteobacteria bacterium]